jgi:Holliday junction resolvasome RuvABC endonuclease subunit
MRILALDCALRTGWAHNSHPDGIGSGVETFETPKGDHPDIRYRDFRLWVADMLDSQSPELVVCEAPIEHHKSKAQQRLSIGLVSRVREEAAVRGIEYREVYSSSLKLYATGSGRATKEQMERAAMMRFETGTIFGLDDNEADALMLLAMALDGFPEREPVRKRKGRTPAPV